MLCGKGPKRFVKIRRVDALCCCSLTELCSSRVLLANDAECVPVFAERFRLSYVPITHVIFAILGSCSPTGCKDLLKHHCGMFIKKFEADEEGF